MCRNCEDKCTCDCSEEQNSEKSLMEIIEEIREDVSWIKKRLQEEYESKHLFGNW